MTGKPKTMAEDMYEAAQELGLRSITLEECQQKALKSKAEASALGLTNEEYIKHRLREMFGEDIPDEEPR